MSSSFFNKSVVSACLIMLAVGQATADHIRVAVASNFADAIRVLAERFEARTNNDVTLIFGSTGKHYAQIINGAPFDAFFAADRGRPELLEQEAVAIPGSRFTYAIGKVVLWSPIENYVDSQGQVLHSQDFRYLAIANPKLAPYGRAAQEVLLARGLRGVLQGRTVRGENIGQTFQFVRSGNAELGFVALSQIKRPGQSMEGSFWEVPQSLYSPIEQQAVQLTDNDTARAFLSFVRSDDSLDLIRSFGYGTP